MASSRSGERQRRSPHTDDANLDVDEEYDSLDRYPENLDYYSILGVSREPPPTDSQLRSAYHNLTLSFHPDKQPAHLVEAAEAQFTRIQAAYETLIDPKKRIVYDLEGEEGVKREWRALERMGRTEQSRQHESHGQVGPRTMPPAEFRKWFLAKMKARERAALDSLVGARGSISIGIDASSLVSFDEEEGSVQLNVPTLRPSRYGVGYTFRTALPDFVWTWISGSRRETEEELPQEDTDAQLPEITFQATVNGPIRKTTQQYEVKYSNGESATIDVEGPLVLGAARFGLGASINHHLADVGLRAGPHSKLWSWLDGATIGSNMDIFPSRSLAMYISKAVSPFPHGKPFTITVTSTMPRDPSRCTPVMAVSVARQFSSRKFGSLTYSTGSFMWPSFVQNILSIFSDFSRNPNPSNHPNLPVLIAAEPSSLLLKYTTVPDAITAEEAEELGYSNTPTTKESWQWSVAASPQGGNLSLVYGRTLFADRLEDPPRSEWNLEGYHPSHFSQSRRGVRIEAEATISLDGGMTWNLSALRRVSELSSVGMGFSIRDSRGLLMSLTWRRLGQSIRLPIAICPLDLVDAQLTAWAVMIPWLTYVGVEFGYIRPRERRRRREAIIRKRKLLKSQISVRKKESAQHIEMMRDLIQRRQEREKAGGGLFVKKAEYGYLPPKNAGRAGELAEPQLIDVTIPLAAHVDKSQLFISKKITRFQIIGFYDPAPLLPKTLRIWYTFRGQHYYAEAKDDEDLACPRREHLELEEPDEVIL